MLNAIKSFAEMSLKVVAVRTADNSDFQFDFPASGLQSTPSDLTAPWELLDQRRLNRLAGIGGWQHGGINE
jgi:hypothetical protein